MLEVDAGRHHVKALLRNEALEPAAVRFGQDDDAVEIQTGGAREKNAAPPCAQPEIPAPARHLPEIGLEKGNRAHVVMREKTGQARKGLAEYRGVRSHEVELDVHQIHGVVLDDRAKLVPHRGMIVPRDVLGHPGPGPGRLGGSGMAHGVYLGEDSFEISRLAPQRGGSRGGGLLRRGSRQRQQDEIIPVAEVFARGPNTPRTGVEGKRRPRGQKEHLRFRAHSTATSSSEPADRCSTC
jgi:hypothetical protein